MSLPLLQESVWFDKYKYDDAECHFYENRVQNNSGGQEASAESAPVVASVMEGSKGSLVDEIAKARKHIQKSLQTTNESNKSSKPVNCSGDALRKNIDDRLASVEQEALILKDNFSAVTKSLQNVLSKLEGRVSILENMINNSPTLSAAISTQTMSPPTQKLLPSSHVVSTPPQVETNGIEEEEDDVDLFGSDEDDEEAEKLRNDRLKAYEEKKAKKPVLIAKSNIILDVKPWDDETDMAEIEKCVRSVKTDGLLWGASKLVPLAYGIKKLQISCVVEDDKVGTDYLEEAITAFEEFVQSVDIVAFNKI